MLIAGDGRSHVYKLNSLDPREWVRVDEGMEAILALKSVRLIRSTRPTPGVIREPEAWEHLTDFSFDVLLTNPPFAGEIRDQGILSHYELARRGVAGMSGRKQKRARRSIHRTLSTASNLVDAWQLCFPKVSSITQLLPHS